MPYKNKEDKSTYRKKYYQENKEKILLQQKESLKNKINSFTEEQRNNFINKRKQSVLNSYYKNRDRILLKNKENSYKKSLKYLYNLSYEEYLQILEKQDNCCAICKINDLSKRWTSKKLPLSVDHCHNTGKVRGLLCDNCNVLIGHAKENITILENSIKYLLENGS